MTIKTISLCIIPIFLFTLSDLYCQFNFDFASIGQGGNRTWDVEYDHSKFSLEFDDKSESYKVTGKDTSFTKVFILASHLAIDKITKGDSLRISFDYETGEINGAISVWSRIDYFDGTKDFKNYDAYTTRSFEVGSMANVHVITKEVKKINFGILFDKGGVVVIKKCNIYLNGQLLNSKTIDLDTWNEFKKDVKPYLYEFENETEILGILERCKGFTTSKLISFGEQTHGANRNHLIREILLDYFVSKNSKLNVFFEYDVASAFIINQLVHTHYNGDTLMDEVWKNGSWPFYIQSFEKLLQKVHKYTHDNANLELNVGGMVLPKADASQRLMALNDKSLKIGEDLVPEHQVNLVSKYRTIAAGNLTFSDEEMEKARMILDQYDNQNMHLLFAHNEHIIKNQLFFGPWLKKQLGDNYYSIAYSFKKGSFNYNTLSKIDVGTVDMTGKLSLENLNDSDKPFILDVKKFRESEAYQKWKEYSFPMLSIGATVNENDMSNSIQLLDAFDLFICNDLEAPTVRYK